MADAETAYQKGLEAKPTVAADRVKATSTVPEERLGVLQSNPWISGCRELSWDPDRCLTFLLHSSVVQAQVAAVRTATSYVQRAPTGSWLLGELRKRPELMVGSHFFDSISNYPWPGEVTPDENGHAKLMSSVASSVVLYHVSVFVQNRRPECIANTLFHELLHVWFLATYSGYNETLGTGHDPGAGVTIWPGCKKSYKGFHDEFRKKLESFDVDLSQKVPGAAKCCS